MGTSIIAFDATEIDGGILVQDSEGEEVLAKNFDQIGKFLLEDYDDVDRGTKYLKVVYDLDQFAGTIFKTLPVELVDKFDDGETKVQYGSFKIFYIPSKMLGIDGKFRTLINGNIYKEDRAETVIYHLKQYYPEALDLPPQDVKDMGIQLINQLQRMGLNPTRLVSPISIYEESVLSHMTVPRACHVPEEAEDALDYSMAVMNREWRSAYRLGYWETAYDYDLTSAYPSLIAKLRDIRQAKWWKSNQEQDCDWGIMKGWLTINLDISPIVCEDNILRSGTWLEYITTEDAKFIRDYKIGDFKAIDGWFMNYAIKDCYPFDIAMNRLFGMRATNHLVKLVSKKISVGLGGKFAEIKYDGSYGDYFNPIYRLMTTDRARLKVAKFIYDHELQDNLIGVMVDGVLADKELKLKGGSLMGNWRLNKPTPALVLSTGYQFTGDKKPGNISFAQIYNAMKAHPNKTSYCDIEFNSISHDRKFDVLPKTGGQLLNNIYESKPISV
ncbi:hypothetical protein KKD37_04745 [Patescibacteria group bacterium]|nr:hypothetical protein [Patescibacteria group bacterium]